MEKASPAWPIFFAVEILPETGTFPASAPPTSHIIFQNLNKIHESEEKISTNMHNMSSTFTPHYVKISRHTFNAHNDHRSDTDRRNDLKVRLVLINHARFGRYGGFKIHIRQTLTCIDRPQLSSRLQAINLECWLTRKRCVRRHK